VNNAYKQKKKSPSSIKYCEVGILENMHCSIYFNILLTNANCDIISKFSDNNTKVMFKRLTISSILSTDMGKHNKLLEKLTKRVKASQNVLKNNS